MWESLGARGVHRVLSETKARYDRSSIYMDANEGGDYAGDGGNDGAIGADRGDSWCEKESKLRNNLFPEDGAPGALASIRAMFRAVLPRFAVNFAVFRSRDTVFTKWRECRECPRNFCYTGHSQVHLYY